MRDAVIQGNMEAMKDKEATKHLIEHGNVERLWHIGPLFFYKNYPLTV